MEEWRKNQKAWTMREKNQEVRTTNDNQNKLIQQEPSVQKKRKSGDKVDNQLKKPKQGEAPPQQVPETQLKGKTPLVRLKRTQNQISKKTTSSKMGSEQPEVDEERSNQQIKKQVAGGNTRRLTVPAKLSSKTVFLLKRKQRRPEKPMVIKKSKLLSRSLSTKRQQAKPGNPKKP